MSLFQFACGCEADAADYFRDGVVVTSAPEGCHVVGDFISSAQLASFLYGGLPSVVSIPRQLVPIVEKPVCDHQGLRAPWLATSADSANGLRDLRCPDCRMILDAPLKGGTE